jgi:hypothetical protein
MSGSGAPVSKSTFVRSGVNESPATSMRFTAWPARSAPAA